ncbi:MAG: ATP-binding protein, partial [Candidatus Omnitrophica bacterium]|nr:ATP-binding protein [Candidatus Omnitrophota bacterium]
MPLNQLVSPGALRAVFGGRQTESISDEEILQALRQRGEFAVFPRGHWQMFSVYHASNITPLYLQRLKSHLQEAAMQQERGIWAANIHNHVNLELRDLLMPVRGYIHILRSLGLKDDFSEFPESLDDWNVDDFWKLVYAVDTREINRDAQARLFRHSLFEHLQYYLEMREWEGRLSFPSIGDIELWFNNPSYILAIIVSQDRQGLGYWYYDLRDPRFQEVIGNIPSIKAIGQTKPLEQFSRTERRIFDNHFDLLRQIRQDENPYAQAHSITAAGQFAASRQYPQLGQQFTYIGNALAELVKRAQAQGVIDYRGPPQDYPVAQRTASAEILWNIPQEQISALLQNSPFDAQYLIEQISIHEAQPTEEMAIKAQASELKIASSPIKQEELTGMNSYASRQAEEEIRIFITEWGIGGRSIGRYNSLEQSGSLFDYFRRGTGISGLLEAIDKLAGRFPLEVAPEFMNRYKNYSATLIFTVIRELVKNSYDAIACYFDSQWKYCAYLNTNYSGEIILEFSLDSSRNLVIQLRDNGLGRNTPSTAYKRRRVLSEDPFQYAGGSGGGLQIVRRLIEDIIDGSGKAVAVFSLNKGDFQSRNTIAELSIPFKCLQSKAHSITAAGQFAASRQYPQLGQQFTYIGNALAELVKRAQAQGVIDYRGPPQDYPVAQRTASAEILWNIPQEQISALLQNSPFDAQYLIEQISIHEAQPTEEMAIKAQAGLMGQLIKEKAAVHQQGRFSPVKVAGPGMDVLTFGKMRFSDINAYKRYLVRRGYGFIAGIKIAKENGLYRVIALVASPVCLINEVDCGVIKRDDTGYPLFMPADERRGNKTVSLLRALVQEGYPEELFISGEPGEEIFFTARLLCRVGTFLSYRGQKQGEVVVARYLPASGSRQIVIRQRQGLSLTGGRDLLSFEVDERGYPSALAPGKTGMSVFDYAKELDLINASSHRNEFTIRQGQDVLTVGNMRYTEITRYFAYLEFIGVRNIAALTARLRPDRIDFYGHTPHSGAQAKKQATRERLLHTVMFDAAGAPIGLSDAESGNTSLLKILDLQGQLDPQKYAEFKRSRIKRRYNSAADVRSALRERRSAKGDESITVRGLDKPATQDGDRNLYFACLEFGVKIKGMRRRAYPKKEDVEKALRLRAARSGGERNNTPAALQRPKSKGGNWPLYYRARAMGIELPQSQRERRTLTLEEVNDRIKGRRALGGDWAITYTALNRPYAQGGDSLLLQSIRRLRREGVRVSLANGLELAAEERKQGPLVYYLGTYFLQEIPPEIYLSELWHKAVIDGEKDSADQLVLGLLPLIPEVIEIDLRITIDPDAKSFHLIEYLLERGSVAIFERMEQWPTYDQPATIIAWFRSMIEEELWQAKKEYYDELEQSPYAPSLDRVLPGENRRGVTEKEMIPDRAASVVDQVAAREAAGLPIILGSKKENLLASLRRIFSTENVFRIFRNGKEYHCAIYVIGSLGNLGTAVVNHADLNLVVVSDAPENYLNFCMDRVAGLFQGELNYYREVVPVVVIGRSGAYRPMVKRLDEPGYCASFIGQFCSALRQARVGSDEKGFGTIEAVSVHPDTEVRRPHVRILAHVGVPEFVFRSGANGIMLLESAAGADLALRSQLWQKVREESRLEANVLLERIEDYFAQTQRENYFIARQLSASETADHPITAAGQFAAIRDYPQYLQQFIYTGSALALLVKRAQAQGVIDYRGPPEEFPIAQRTAPVEILWNIPIEQIPVLLADTPFDAKYLIEQIKLHESRPTEQAAILAQVESFGNTSAPQTSSFLSGQYLEVDLALSDIGELWSVMLEGRQRQEVLLERLQRSFLCDKDYSQDAQEIRIAQTYALGRFS